MSFHLQPGRIPLVVSMPHLGTEVPDALQAGYQPRALAVEDTDWHLDRLYDFVRALGASVLRPVVSRYVIDLNRPPDDTPMYPGASNTELCPTPSHRFPLGRSTGLPPTRPSSSECPVRSWKGPSGLRDRAANTP